MKTLLSFPLGLRPLATAALATVFAAAAVAAPAAKAPVSSAVRARQLVDTMAFGPGGSLVDVMMAREARTTLDSARRARVPDDIVDELERTFRNFFEKIVEETVVPIYTETFSTQELDELILFFGSAPGRKFRDQIGSTPTTVNQILAKTGAHRPAIEAFLKTPTGQHYIATSTEISKRAQQEMFQKSASRSNELSRQIQALRNRHRF